MALGLPFATASSNPFPSNHARGWLLHFDVALAPVGEPGAFGWDDTASIVPAGLVPSYLGTSGYLLMTKYNNYAGIGGNGVNRIALLDPHASMTDPISGIAVTRAVLVNNEDGTLYRWDLTTGALSESLVLTAGLGEAYTPTILGPDGTVYAINDATLFAVGQ